MTRDGQTQNVTFTALTKSNRIMASEIQIDKKTRKWKINRINISTISSTLWTVKM